MALSRSYLKGMGLTEEQVGAIIEAHSETVEALKKQRDEFKDAAEQLKGVQKELNDLKAAGDGGYKEKYEAEKTAHDALKKQIEDGKAHDAKLKAVTDFYEGKKITGKNLAIALRGTNIDSFELDGDKLKDTTALDELVKGDFAGLVSTTETKGANTATPPGNSGGSGMTKADIMKITDRNERRKQIAEHMDLFTQKES